MHDETLVAYDPDFVCWLLCLFVGVYFVLVQCPLPVSAVVFVSNASILTRFQPLFRLFFRFFHQGSNHKSPYRRWRHVINLIMFKSSTIQRLAFPELGSVAMVSVGLAIYNEFILGAGQMLSFSPSAL